MISIILALVAILALGGCATRVGEPVLIDKLLLSSLPVNHTGYLKLRTKNASQTIVIEGGGFAMKDGRWTWTWLTWSREGRASDGQIQFGTKPE